VAQSFWWSQKQLCYLGEIRFCDDVSFPERRSTYCPKAEATGRIFWCFQQKKIVIANFTQFEVHDLTILELLLFRSRMARARRIHAGVPQSIWRNPRLAHLFLK
jgi:hypothetical protein